MAPIWSCAAPQGNSLAPDHGINDLRAALVLRGPGGKSADFVNASGHLHPSLVLPRPQQDSTQMTEEIRPHRAKLVLSHVPGKTREGRRKLERLEDHSSLLAHSPELEPPRREVVGVTPSPRCLGPRSPCRLA